MNPQIKLINPINNYQLILEFTNGELAVYDCKHLLGSGGFKELHDINYFKQVAVTDGAVTWPHGQAICPDTLYAESHKLDAPYIDAPLHQ